MAYSFLLDEHMMPFPGLPLDLFGFDIVRLRDFNPAFINTETPDWVLYLAAAKAGLTGVITHDNSQLEQENEMLALERSGLALITYRKGTNDELTKWGLLMAYAPRIMKILENGNRGVITLPAPSTPESRPASQQIAGIARRNKSSQQEVRDRASKAMSEEIARLGLDFTV